MNTSFFKTAFVVLSSAFFLGGIFFVTAPADQKKEGSGEKVSREVSEAYEAMKSYGYEKKEQFLKWAEARSNEMDKKIEALKRESKQAGEKVREDLKEAEADLEQQKQKLAEKMAEIKKSGAEAWEDAKWGFSAALDKLERAYERAKAKMMDEESGEKKK